MHTGKPFLASPNPHCWPAFIVQLLRDVRKHCISRTLAQRRGIKVACSITTSATSAGLLKKGVLVYACVRALTTLAGVIFISSFFHSSKYRAAFFPPRRNFFFPTFRHPEMRFLFLCGDFLAAPADLALLAVGAGPSQSAFWKPVLFLFLFETGVSSRMLESVKWSVNEETRGCPVT